MVSTADLKCQLDLRKIALEGRNVEYNSIRFSSATMRIKEPKASASIFSSGIIVCKGAKSEEISKYATRKFAKEIRKIGFAVKVFEFKIVNIAGSCNLGFPINL